MDNLCILCVCDIYVCRITLTFIILSELHNRSLEMQFPYDITVTRRENEGFGFVIISSVTKSGSTIGMSLQHFL